MPMPYTLYVTKARVNEAAREMGHAWVSSLLLPVLFGGFGGTAFVLLWVMAVGPFGLVVRVYWGIPAGLLCIILASLMLKSLELGVVSLMRLYQVRKTLGGYVRMRALTVNSAGITIYSGSEGLHSKNWGWSEIKEVHLKRTDRGTYTLEVDFVGHPTDRGNVQNLLIGFLELDEEDRVHLELEVSKAGVPIYIGE